MQTDLSNPQWYALRVTYCREMLVKRHLDALGVENFIPMHYKEITFCGRKKRILAPALHNLIFVRTTLAALREIKFRSRLPVCFINDRVTTTPLIIPDKQMRDFIAVAGSCDEQLVYLDAPKNDLQRGDRVRITAGPLQGVEGIFMRIRGDRRVVVTVEGIMAVATAFLHPSMLEKIEI